MIDHKWMYYLRCSPCRTTHPRRINKLSLGLPPPTHPPISTNSLQLILRLLQQFATPPPTPFSPPQLRRMPQSAHEHTSTMNMWRAAQARSTVGVTENTPKLEPPLRLTHSRTIHRTHMIHRWQPTLSLGYRIALALESEKTKTGSIWGCPIFV